MKRVPDIDTPMYHKITTQRRPYFQISNDKMFWLMSPSCMEEENVHLAVAAFTLFHPYEDLVKLFLYEN
jgi:hypothetical protein